MKKILFLFLFIQFCSLTAQKSNEGKLFIIGGGSRPVAMVQRIISESGIDKDGYGVVLPMSSIYPDTAIFYATKQFKELGFNNIYGLNFAKNEQLNKGKLDSIRNAKLIYISGGDQSNFMAIVGGTEIEAAIYAAFSNGSLIAGTSAGAAVMSEKMITGTELKYPENSTFRNIESDNLELKPGLGLLKTAIIDQHFVKRSRHNRLISAIIDFPNLLGIGIDESTAILIKGFNAEVIGDSQVLVYKNSKKIIPPHNGKLSARKIRLDIYTDGDTFKVK